jgi:hypothetical protein
MSNHSAVKRKPRRKRKRIKWALGYFSPDGKYHKWPKPTGKQRPIIDAPYKPMSKKERERAFWRTAWRTARRTARWAITMTRYRVSRLRTKTAWQLVTFTGPAGGESVGVVDILAVRKCHAPGRNGLKRGDMLEIVLIQVKGGGAPRPTIDDIRRLRALWTSYNAKAVILAEWKKGKQPTLYKLARRGNDVRCVWQEMADPLEVFK